MCRYLYAFNAAMAGELAIVRDALPSLRPDSEDGVGMAASIEAIVERAERVGGVLPLDARDLRGWHYVLSGSLLAHHSPFGFDAPMRGRYGWLKDSVERIAFGLDRLAPLARAVGAPCVYAPPGRSHEVLATAVAARLGLPLAPWPAIGVPAPGLVVLYDLREVSADDAARLSQRRPEQLVFAHAARLDARRADRARCHDAARAVRRAAVGRDPGRDGRRPRGRARRESGAGRRGSRARRAGPVGRAGRACVASAGDGSTFALARRWAGRVEPVRVIPSSTS